MSTIKRVLTHRTQGATLATLYLVAGALAFYEAWRTHDLNFLLIGSLFLTLTSKEWYG